MTTPNENHVQLVFTRHELSYVTYEADIESADAERVAAMSADELEDYVRGADLDTRIIGDEPAGTAEEGITCADVEWYEVSSGKRIRARTVRLGGEL